MNKNVEEDEQKELQALIQEAQSGDPQSMEELGDHYISLAGNDRNTSAFRIGIEWYERAARCNNYQAILRLEEITGEKFTRLSYSGFDTGVFLIAVLCFLVFSSLAVKHNIHLVSVFLILVSCLNLVMIMRGVYCYNEIINDPDLAKWIISKKFVSIYMMVSVYLSALALIAGFVLARWAWDHNRIGILVIKALILIICIVFISKEFSRVVKTKWKFVEHKPYIDKIANDFGASRIQVELVIFSLEVLGCIAVVLLSTVMIG